MNSKKIMMWIIILLSVMVMSLLGFIIYKEMNVTSDNSNITESDVKNRTFEVLDITDEEVMYIDNLLSIVTIFEENNDILSILFSGKDKVVVDDLTAEQKLFFAVRAYVADKYLTREFSYCIDDSLYNAGLEDLVVSKKDLEGYFVEDSSYLNNLTDDETIYIGEFEAVSKEDNVSICRVIYGIEGPGIDGISIEPVSAYKDGDKVVVSAKFLYTVMDSDYDDPKDIEHFRYNVYESYDSSGQVIETIDYYMSNGYMDRNDLTKYDNYDITFRVVDGKYLFESIERK